MSVLNQGGTVVVPSRQRAVAVRLAHTRARIAEHASAWASCDVLPWAAWLERCAGQARHGTLQGLRRLNGAEEWLLWAEAAEEACAGRDVLLPAGLADALQRSCALVRDWGLRWAGAPTTEASVLRQARDIFARRCQELGAYCPTDWAIVLRDVKALPNPTLFAGFSSPGTALGARLRQLGGTFWTVDEGKLTREANIVVACADGVDELCRAAHWCRERLQVNPAARLLVVVPQLAQRRAAAVQAFEHGLHGSALLGDPVEPLYAIEGGQPLADYPIVVAALGLIALGGGAVEFMELAALLRSAYVGLGSAPQRAALELSLRERNVHVASFAQLHELARPDATLAVALDGVAAAMTVPPLMREGAGGWARRFAVILEACGWPGKESLGSEEQQQRDRFRELLGELAMLGSAGTLLKHAEALQLLRALAARTAFDVASGDVPVTLSASIDDPLVTYEGIWVAGLGAETWPAALYPDPFVPLAVQRAAGVPQTSPQGQLKTAQRSMAAWQRSTAHLVLSWPQFDGEVPLRPSSLFAKNADSIPTGLDLPAYFDPLVTALRASGRRERRPADQALAWPVGLKLAGGTKALQLQSLCPFRAVAELRLGAAPVAEPVPGLDRLERGQILHRALELVWTQLRDSSALRERTADERALATLAQSAAERAMRERLAARVQPLASPLAQNEVRRLVALIIALLRQDLLRADSAGFAIAQLEDSQERELGGLPIRVRMDRLDHLEDGRLIVIDYKSGAAQPFRPLDERPRQPQLLAYALLAAGEVAGVAAVYLNADQIRWRGVAAEPDLLPALGRIRAPTAPWPELMRHWRRVIDGLVREFAAGIATVDPLPGACKTCHLPALCRIDAVRRNEADPDSEDAVESTDER